MTEYVVLARNDEGLWIEGPRVEAVSAEAAVRAAVEKQSTPSRAQVKPQPFVAVPARSWKPVSVSVKTIHQVQLGDPETAPEPAEEST